MIYRDTKTSKVKQNTVCQSEMYTLININSFGQSISVIAEFFIPLMNYKVPT